MKNARLRTGRFSGGKNKEPGLQVQSTRVDYFLASAFFSALAAEAASAGLAASAPMANRESDQGGQKLVRLNVL